MTRHHRDRSVILLLVAGAAMSATHPASAQSWNNAAGGAWNNAANWSPMTVPNGPAAAAQIDLPGIYTVTVPSASTFQVGTLSIGNPSAVLQLANASRLQFNTGLSNDALITVNTGSGSSNTSLEFLSPLSISGSGLIRLQANNNFNNSSYLGSLIASDVIVHSADHTIDGIGRIYSSIDNKGLIDANVPGGAIDLLTSSKANSGAIRASGGGILQLTGIALMQNGSGVLRATGTGSEVRLSNSIVTGGLLDAAGGGIIVHNASTFNTLDGVTLTGPMAIANAGNMILGPTGLVNNGSVEVNSGAASATTTIRATADTTLSGTGVVTLRALVNFDNSALITYTATSDILTHAAGHTIRGAGRIAVQLDNQGLVEADFPGRAIEFTSFADAANSGMIRGTNGGFVQFSGVDVLQSGAGQVQAGAGDIRFNNASITAGSLSSSGGGTIVSNSLTTNTFDDVSIAGGSIVQISNASSLVIGPGGLMNDGSISINTGGLSSTTRLTVGPVETTLGGSGEVILNAIADGSDSAIIHYTAPAVGLTQGSSHTIRGRGRIHAALTNNGRVIADRFVSGIGQALELVTTPKINNNLMRAEGGGRLYVTGITVSQGAAGRIEAQGAGSTVSLRNAAIVGGELRSLSGGEFECAPITTDTLENVTLSGTMRVANAASLRFAGGALLNNGSIFVNDGGSSSTTSIVPLVNTTISGAGTIRLQAHSNYSNSAIITYADSSTLTLGAGQSILGTGRIFVGLTNNGVVNADVPGRVIELIDRNKINDSLFSATSGGILQLTGHLLTQGPAGLTAAIGAGSEVRLSNATIVGGGLAASDGGLVITNPLTTCAMDGVAISGPLQITNASTADLGAAGLVNNGAIAINTGGGSSMTRLRAPGAATISGTGTISLNANALNDSAQIQAAGGAAAPLILGPGQTVAGLGRLYGAIVSQGTLSPGTPTTTGELQALNGSLSMASSSALDIQINSATTHDRISGNADITVDGALNVTSLPAYTPAGSDIITIITGSSVSGRFDTVSLPTTGYFGPAHVVYGATSVRVVMCYANCDGSTVQPTLNVDDFTCFINEFAAAQTLPHEQQLTSYPNCDGSTVTPVLNIDDFICFINAFAAGCP